MTWPFTRREITASTLLAERTSGRMSRGYVNREQALRHSAVWACLRLRADLISTMPVDVFKRMNGVQVEQTKPAVMVAPDGKRMRWDEFVYATQFDLDSAGNTVGVITAINALGKPDRIELVNINDVTFKGTGNRVTSYKVGQREYPPEQIWHERQYVISGVPVGLSPIAYAALSLQAGIAAKEFAANWFLNSTLPSGHLKNTAKVLKREEAQRVKDSFKAAVQAGDIWASGSDWEFNLVTAKASESQFLETQAATAADICRYLGVPGDMIDVETATGSITYANVTQRNLQLLILNLGPAIVRREQAFSVDMLPAPRYVKFNTSALLRMDPKARLEAHKLAIDSRIYPPSRALDLENMAPLTAEEVAEFAVLFPAKSAQPEQPVMKARDEQHFHMDLPPVTMNVNTPDIDLPDVVVHQAPAPDVHVDVHVPRAAGPEIRVETPTPAAAPEVHIDVHVPEQPAPDVKVEVTNDVKPTDVVLPKRRRKVVHDNQGRVAETIEEDL